MEGKLARLFQIGDLVLITSCEEVRPVKEVKENGVYTTNEFSSITRLYRCNEIEQIPLTDEILEKNGFSINVFENCMYYDFPKNAGFNELIKAHYHLIKYNSDDYYFFEDCPFIKVKAVDEFQRLLRLMGYVDFANNFKV